MPSAQLELLRGPLGYPVPTDAPENGSVILDEKGVAWLATRIAGKSMNFRFSDGLSGTPAGRRDYYNEWRIVWWPPDAEVAVPLITK